MKRSFIFLLSLTKYLLSVYCSPLHAQGIMEPSGQKDTATEVYTEVDQAAYFEGSLEQFLSATLVYPADARDAGIEGVVQVCFYVNEDGTQVIL